jgi:energy-coupling factor transporter ATP-binding protein EcfA2
MWEIVRRLRDQGVTIILTTHYIEEAEEMADRVGVIRQGRADPGRGQGRADAQAGQKAADPAAAEPLAALPGALGRYALELGADGHELTYTFDAQAERDRHRRPAAPICASRHRVSRTCTPAKLARRHLRRSGEGRPNEREPPWRADLHASRWPAGARCCRASPRRCSRPRSISWSSARPSARA